jgi:hypothetical protein
MGVGYGVARGAAPARASSVPSHGPWNAGRRAGPWG